MSTKPRPSRPRHKPRPRSRPRLFLPTPLPLPQTSLRAHWAPQPIRLEELVRVYPLPQLVRCRTQGVGARDGGPLVLPLDSPILLAEKRTARHLLARIVLYDDKSKTFNESMDSVVIPEDYEGHFLRLQSRTTKDKTKVKSLEAIAQDDTPAFLNLSDITSYPAHHPGTNDKSRFIYTVGNVFLVDEPLPSQETRSDDGAGNDRTKSAVSGSSRQIPASTTTSGRSSNGVMKCLDERGMPIIVPTDQAGDMVTVQKSGPGESKLSVKSSDMIVNQQFPLLARYAYGKTHPRLLAFSKLLTLLDTFQETSIIACTIDSATIMLMEIPLDSSLTFQVALNLDDLLKVPRMRRALEVCRTRGRELSRDIKFKYKFSHRVQESSRGVRKKEEEEDFPSATVRTRLVVTETYVYI